MGRKRLGEFPSVVVGLRIPGEWIAKLTEGGKSAAEAIKDVLAEHLNGDRNSQGVRSAGKVRLAESGTRAPKRAPEPARESAPEERPKGKTCEHGKSRGYHCWQCGGLAKVG
jgi:hypothetical protein